MAVGVTVRASAGPPHASHTTLAARRWPHACSSTMGGPSSPARCSSPQRISVRITGYSSRPACVSRYSCLAGCSLYCRRSRIPAPTSERSRAASVSRGAPVRRTISSKRRLPRNTSRTASSAHFSPTISSVRATEHSRGWAATAVMPPGYLIRPQIARTARRSGRVSPNFGLTEVIMSVGAETRVHPSPKPARTGLPGEGQTAWQVSVIVGVLALAVFMSSLDLLIVNLAFPYIGREYHGTSLGSLSWVLNAYTIVFAAVLVPAGRWADRVGRRRVLIGGLAAFVLGSVLCGVAPGVAA